VGKGRGGKLEFIFLGSRFGLSPAINAILLVYYYKGRSIKLRPDRIRFNDVTYLEKRLI